MERKWSKIKFRNVAYTSRGCPNVRKKSQQPEKIPFYLAIPTRIQFLRRRSLCNFDSCRPLINETGLFSNKMLFHWAPEFFEISNQNPWPNGKRLKFSVNVLKNWNTGFGTRRLFTEKLNKFCSTRVQDDIKVAKCRLYRGKPAGVQSSSLIKSTQS